MNFSNGSEVIVSKPYKMPVAGVIDYHKSETCYKVYTQLPNGEIVHTLEDLASLTPIDKVYKSVFKTQLENIKNHMKSSSKSNERLELFNGLVNAMGLEKATESFAAMGWEIPEC